MPAVTRIGDMDRFHCSQPYRLQGSLNVRCNGKGISRRGDLNAVHLKPCVPICCGHAAPIAIGSLTVFVNGKGCGRVADKITSCTEVFQGSPNVFAG